MGQGKCFEHVLRLRARKVVAIERPGRNYMGREEILVRNDFRGSKITLEITNKKLQSHNLESRNGHMGTTSERLHWNDFDESIYQNGKMKIKSERKPGSTRNEAK